MEVPLTYRNKLVTNGIEILTIECGKFTVTSVYHLPGKNLNFIMQENFGNQNTQFIIGDFNCHSV